MRTAFVLVFLAATGCSTREEPPAESAPSPVTQREAPGADDHTLPTSNVIAVGLPWAEAETVAREAGYDPQVTPLQMVTEENVVVEGFQLDLPDGRVLTATRDARANTLDGLLLEQPGPKIREEEWADSFELPPAASSP